MKYTHKELSINVYLLDGVKLSLIKNYSFLVPKVDWYVGFTIVINKVYSVRKTRKLFKTHVDEVIYNVALTSNFELKERNILENRENIEKELPCFFIGKKNIEKIKCFFGK